MTTGSTTTPLADDLESLPEWAPRSAHLMAGALAGIAEHTLTYPLDMVKTRLQLLSSATSATGAASYTGLLNALHRIAFVETAGPRQFWRGVQSVILGAGPAHAVYFAAYEASKQAMGPADSSLVHAASGAVATILADALMTPFDVAKQRLQLPGPAYAGLVDCFRRVLAREGLRAFYVSYPTTLLLNIPFHGIQFPVYEFASKHLRRDPNGYRPVEHVMAGGLAGAVAAFLTTPLDVLKTTLQTKGEFAHHQHLRGMWDAGSHVLRSQGFGGLWRGAVPRCLTFMPSTGICWGVYEYFKRSFLKTV